MSDISKERVISNIKIPNNTFVKLKKDFPECFDKNGNFDIEKFKKELQTSKIDFSKESYGLDWLGKSYARVLANDETITLLKEDEEWNKKNKDSKNILIKGDNLEVLKHLFHAYYEKIKMIYIDPPYNTGSDGFVYQDDRKFTIDELSQLAGIDEEKAKRILDFTRSKSNSHSAWLTFMYPRLYIARQLLRDDGVIFVSIDDNEVAQLRLLMDEIFGEENFVAEFVWTGKSGSEDDSHIRNNKEYILSYAKYIDMFDIGLDEKKDEKFIYFDKDKNDYYKRQLLRKWGDNSKREDRPNLYYSIKDDKGNDFYPTLPSGEDGCWRWSKDTMQKAIDEGRIEFAYNGRYEAYEKIYKNDLSKKQKKFKSMLVDIGNSATGTKEIKEYFDNQKVFTNPKPTILIKRLCQIANTKSNDLVFDFFAGSGTTGDAVMQLNAEDRGDRKFILVQLPEPIDPKKNKTAYDFVKNELEVKNPTIFDITKERLVRAGRRIMENGKWKMENFDSGFKIFETTPIWEDYNFKAKEFSENLSLFDESKLSNEDLKTLLTTWKTYDGIALVDSLNEIDLGGYGGYYFDNKLYLIHKGFKTNNLKKLLEKIDKVKDFNPSTIIAFGYNFESKILREIAENIKSYSNKKDIDIDFITRY